MLTKLNEELMKFRKGGMYEGMFPERWLPAVVGILPEPLTAQNGTVNSTSKGFPSHNFLIRSST